MKEAELLNLRKIDCDLEGHPTPVSKPLFITVEAWRQHKYLSTSHLIS